MTRTSLVNLNTPVDSSRTIIPLTIPTKDRHPTKYRRITMTEGRNTRMNTAKEGNCTVRTKETRREATSGEKTSCFPG